VVDTILSYVFVGLFALLALLGLLKRSKRIALWFAAACAAGAGVAAYSDAFWPMVGLALLGLWAGVFALDVADAGWRLRLGLVLVPSLLAFLALWPTADRMTGGRIPCPRYIEEKVGFRMIAGLDLRGGLRLVYTVDVDEAIKDRRDRYYEDMRRELTKIYGLHHGDAQPTEDVYKKLRDQVDLEAPRRPADVIRLRVRPGIDPAKIDQRFLEQFRGELTFARSRDGRSFDFSVKEKAESQIRERAVSQAREIILRRVDELGLREASVSTRDEDIIVEVPGEDEKSFATIRDIISQTARLEFKLLDDETDYFGDLRARMEAKNETAPVGLEFLRETAPVGLGAENEAKTKQISFVFLKKQPQEDSKRALGRLQAWVNTLVLPPDREVGFQLEYQTDPDTLKQTESGWRTFLLKSRAEITGDMIRDATAQPDQSRGALGGWHVALTFTDQGGRIFERITGANVKRRFAIILDGRTESAPVIQSRIPGGHAQITLGSSDPEVQLKDARKLELVLRSGALPAPISPSNEQRIGPSLGRDAIKLGVQGALGGSLLVLLFMLVIYERAGVIANLAVILNLILQLSILATFGASMTLPGIAGLALTVGMAVDSNIIINERIREELGLGKSPRGAVEIGYRRALNAIIDGHVTTVIAGLVLWQYGTGPLKGFAVTLVVGVVCNIFTGVVVSRLMVDFWVRTLKRGATLDLG
jgi:preprotein translocase subunit SecD